MKTFYWWILFTVILAWLIEVPQGVSWSDRAWSDFILASIYMSQIFLWHQLATATLFFWFLRTWSGAWQMASRSFWVAASVGMWFLVAQSPLSSAALLLGVIAIAFMGYFIQSLSEAGNIEDFYMGYRLFTPLVDFCALILSPLTSALFVHLMSRMLS